MKTIVFCAVIIAGSTFTMAVEDVYGWSKVRPHAEAVWSQAYGMGAELVGMEAHAEATAETQDAEISGAGPASE
jgi:N-methylhydantoinase A/oxoprolinase/acetone carboxylase beta subunit